MISGAEGDRRPAALVLRALQLGDLLVAVPALRAIRRALPDHRLVLATSGWLAPVVDLVGAVDDLLPVAALEEPLPFTPGVVDVAVNLHGGGPQSAAAVDALGARLTVRHALTAGDPGPAWIEDLHERVRWVRLVQAAGMPGDPVDVRIARPSAESPSPGATVVHVGAAFPSRAWPIDRFASVARALEDAGRHVVFSGSAGERPRALDAARLGGFGTDRVLAGRMGLAEFAALIADAAVVVTADTGAGHLASAYGTPSVVLFGPVPPERWGPPPGPHIALTHAALRVGDPFAATPDPALAAITPDEVLTAIARLPPRC